MPFLSFWDFVPGPYPKYVTMRIGLRPNGLMIRNEAEKKFWGSSFKEQLFPWSRNIRITYQGDGSIIIFSNDQLTVFSNFWIFHRVWTERWGMGKGFLARGEDQRPLVLRFRMLDFIKMVHIFQLQISRLFPSYRGFPRIYSLRWLFCSLLSLREFPSARRLPQPVLRSKPTTSIEKP